MRPVNLLPKDGPGDRRRRPPVALLAAGAVPVLAAALVVAGWSTEHGRAHQRSDELATVRAQVAALQPTPDMVAAARLASLRVSRTQEIESVLAQRASWDRFLDDVARVLPGDVWLTQLSVQSSGASAKATTTAASAPPGLQLSGEARSQAAVARLLARLAIVPGLSDVTLDSTSSSSPGTKAGGKTVVQFQIAAAIGGGS